MEGQIDKNEKDNTWLIVCVCISAIVLLVVLLHGDGNYSPPIPSSTITNLQMRIQRLEQCDCCSVAQHQAEQDPPVVPRLSESSKEDKSVIKLDTDRPLIPGRY
jgi:hypothetical protein